jgi:isopentenyl phosphate kinase
LAQKLYPSRILLAGLEDAIWLDFPGKLMPIKKISFENFDLIRDKIGQSESPDVTGGMIEKVKIMLNLTKKISGLKISIFSGKETGNISRVFYNQEIGTCIERE